MDIEETFNSVVDDILYSYEQEVEQDTTGITSNDSLPAIYKKSKVTPNPRKKAMEQICSGGRVGNDTNNRGLPPSRSTK